MADYLEPKGCRNVCQLARQRKLFVSNRDAFTSACTILSPQPSTIAQLPAGRTLHTLPNNLLRQFREILPALLLHHLPQIRLREHRQRIPRNILPATLCFATTHEMRHRLQRAARDQLQCQAGLEGQAVAWDVHLRGAAGAVADPEAGFGVGVGL